MLTTVLNAVSATHPDIHLELHELVSKEQLAALFAGELDLGLVAGGRGIAFVPASATRLAIRGISYLPIAGEADRSGSVAP